MPSEPKLVDLATLCFAYFAVGVTVSVALVDRGASTGTILGAALFVYSATSELAYIAVDKAGGSMVAGVLSGWLVATRFGLLAVSLGRIMDGSVLRRSAAALNAFDPNVALAIQQTEPKRMLRTYWRVTAALLIGWWIGTLCGLLLGNVLGDTQRYGLDAVFPAALLAIIGGLLRRGDALLAALVGSLVCLALIPFVPAGIPILASVIGAFIGARVSASEVNR